MKILEIHTNKIRDSNQMIMKITETRTNKTIMKTSEIHTNQINRHQIKNLELVETKLFLIRKVKSLLLQKNKLILSKKF